MYCFINFRFSLVVLKVLIKICKALKDGELSEEELEDIESEIKKGK